MAPQAGSDDVDTTASERRLQPELAEVVPTVKAPLLDNEFDLDPPDEEDADATRNRRVMRQMGGVARQVALNPDDGMEL